MQSVILPVTHLQHWLAKLEALESVFLGAACHAAGGIFVFSPRLSAFISRAQRGILRLCADVRTRKQLEIIVEQ